MTLIDSASQFAVMILSVLAMILVSQNNRWGFVVGLVTQPCWFFTTIYHQQWPLFCLSVAYLFVWMNGIRSNFFRKKKVIQQNGDAPTLEPEEQRKLCEGIHQAMLDAKPFYLILPGTHSVDNLQTLLKAITQLYKVEGFEEVHCVLKEGHIILKPHDKPNW